LSLTAQLYKLIDVLKVSDITNDGIVATELALIKVRCNNLNRGEILGIAQIYGAQIVDAAETTVIVQATGDEEHMERLLRLLRPYGIREIARTGRIALARGSGSTTVEAETPEVHQFHAHEGRMPQKAFPFVSD
jgi:acetolactate synthase I/III small subunit